MRSNMRVPHDDSKVGGAEMLGSSLSKFAPGSSDTISAIAASGRIDRHDEVLHGESSREVGRPRQNTGACGFDHVRHGPVSVQARSTAFSVGNLS